MNRVVDVIMPKAVEVYSTMTKQDDRAAIQELKAVFNSDANFLEKTSEFDAVFERHTNLEPLQEPLFDLLMYNFFESDLTRLEGDYLESEEWADIEEKTIHRGTELLNLLLYIAECRQEDIEPGLGDFLKEFLLVEDDEFQDEFEIYEPLIANQQAVEYETGEILKIAHDLPDASELKEVFAPVILFFRDGKYVGETINELAADKTTGAVFAAIYTILTSANE